MEYHKTSKAIPMFTILFVVGFVIGTFGVQFIDNMAWEGLFSFEWINRFLYLDIERAVFLNYCLRQRILLYLFLLLVCFSSTSFLFGGILIFFLGLYLGAMMSIACLQQGIKGLLLFLCLLFPQGLLYLASGIIYYDMLIRFRQHKKIIVILLLFTMTFTIGILLESYVNPIILHKMLKKIY